MNWRCDLKREVNCDPPARRIGQPSPLSRRAKLISTVLTTSRSGLAWARSAASSASSWAITATP